MRKIISLAVIIALGILSRIAHTGWIVFDKYLGDALYAAMGYTLISLFFRDRTARWRAVVAMLAMTVKPNRAQLPFRAAAKAAPAVLNSSLVRFPNRRAREVLLCSGQTIGATWIDPSAAAPCGALRTFCLRGRWPTGYLSLIRIAHSARELTVPFLQVIEKAANIILKSWSPEMFGLPDLGNWVCSSARGDGGKLGLFGFSGGRP